MPARLVVVTVAGRVSPSPGRPPTAVAVERVVRPAGLSSADGEKAAYPRRWCVQC
jgi:hypothetical protein